MLSQKLKRYEKEVVFSEENSIKYHISTVMIEKLEKIINELSNNETDLHKYVSTLRYTLETLIITKLLVKESDYFLKMYYSLHIHQENKIKHLISRLENEIELLKKYAISYNLEIQKNKKKYSSDSRKLFDEDEKVFKSFKQEAQSNINIFYNKLEKYGFDILVSYLEEKNLKIYKKRLNEFENLTLNKAKHLAKEPWFKEYFDVKGQHSKVFKSLTDVRSWKEKACVVDLKDEYELNYEMTSSLLHFTSYSLFTSNEINIDEINYNNMIINQYVNQITTNISDFSKVMILDIFTTIKV